MKNYNGLEVEKHARIQIEINSHKVIPVSFKKTEQEKIDLINAKSSFRSLQKDPERLNNYREEILRAIVNGPAPNFNLTLKPIR